MTDNLEEIVKVVLNSCYNSPDRYYHNVKHINNMLATFDSLFKQDPSLTNKIKDYNAFRYAIKFHDAIYFVKNAEEKSAEFAKIMLKDSGLDLDYIQELILATRYDIQDTYSFDCMLIRDLDLKELGSTYTEYLHNAFNIRQENFKYSDEIYAKGRALFLKKILNLPKIFETEYFEKLESSARYNIAKELQSLSKS